MLSFLGLILSITVYEAQLGYWVSDIIREHYQADFVFLPKNFFSDSGFQLQDSLVIINVSQSALESLVKKTIKEDSLPAISGFSVLIQGTNKNPIIVINNKKKSYLLVTTKSLNLSSKYQAANEKIPEILRAHLERQTFITEPALKRYQFINLPTDTFQVKKININTADTGELIKLPGIGPKLAEEIIKYRLEHGAFKRVSDIKNVPGIGTKRYQKIKDLITVN
jgi:comEA protein